MPEISSNNSSILLKDLNVHLAFVTSGYKLLDKFIKNT